MQRGFLPPVPGKTWQYWPAFSDYTSKPVCSGGHGHCRKNTYFLPKCVFGQECVLFSRSWAMTPLYLSDTAGSIPDNRRSREDGTKGKPPCTFERTSIPLSFPSPSGCQESLTSGQRRCIEWRAPNKKRCFLDPATRYDTRDPATHPLPRKQSPVWQACPGCSGANEGTHTPLLHTQSRLSRLYRSIRSPSRR